MSSYVLWLDTQEAHIYKFLPGKVEKQNLKNTHPQHHTHNPKEEKHPSDHFYHEVANALSQAQELLIVGPGIAQEQFKHHLEKHHHGALNQKVLSVESMGHCTDGQIEAHARKFFKTQHLFS